MVEPLPDPREPPDAERDVAIGIMEEWFHTHFEDPQNETMYDSEDGRYVYGYGGPFDAKEMLYDQFSDEYGEDWINAATDNVQSDGTYEWAPSSFGDYYDHPESDDIDVAALATDDGEPDRGEVADTIYQKLDELEALLPQLPITASALGHNQPPESIGLPPYNDEDQAELISAIKLARNEVSEDQPDRKKLQEAESTFARVGMTILK